MALTIVTGAPGWLGLRLVRVLTEGLPDETSIGTSGGRTPVRCLVQPGRDTAALMQMPGSVEIVEGDICDDAALHRLTEGAEGASLFHCAGVIHPHAGTRQFYNVNVDGTRMLLKHAERTGTRRAIVVSSNSPLGVNPRPDHVFDEESPYNPYMNYGRSKMLMEQMIHGFQGSGRLETVIIRAPWFYGPDQPARQTLFFKMIRDGKVPVVGNGTNRRSMAYIDNLCVGLLLAERVAEANGRTYWIADKQPYEMNEIIDTVERLMESEFGISVAHKRMRLPFVAGEVATVADRLIQSMGAYNQKIHVLSEMNKTIVCSIARAGKELGFVPHIDLEEGMRRSLRWCIDRGLLS